MSVTAYQLASRYIGVTERSGLVDDHPFILAWLQQCDRSIVDDEIPWCAAFAHHIAWLLDLPRSRSLAARSWLSVGRVVESDLAAIGFDVVILKRGSGLQPGPEVVKAPGHVGYFSGWSQDRLQVLVLGGNQGNSVNISLFPAANVLGIRRL